MWCHSLPRIDRFWYTINQLWSLYIQHLNFESTAASIYLKFSVFSAGVYGFGNNHSGQLGLEKMNNNPMSFGAQYADMQLIPALKDKNIIQIACGGYYSLVLTGKSI